ncbi:MAG: transcription elongation factor GreA [Acutalibacteraceae bacterium]
MFMAKEVRLTSESLKKLQEELDYLKTTKRDEMAEKIEIARSYGDLSENAEYDEAKNEQAVMEARIVELEAMLENAVVIEEIYTGKVRVGSVVKVKNLTRNKELEYKIVGSNDADPLNGMLSDESPVGMALMDKEPGDIVEVEVPAGVVKYEVLEVLKSNEEN